MPIKKPITGAQRTAASKAKYQKAGLIQAKVWIHPGEAPMLRVYASRRPLTKTIMKELKS